MADDFWDRRKQLIDTAHLSIDTPAGRLLIQAETLALPVCSRVGDQITEFYLIEQTFMINPSALYSLDPMGLKGFFAKRYVIETWPTDYLDYDKCELLMSSPDTTVGATSYSASFSHTLSGSIGFFGADGTATVSASETATNSQSVSIQDITVTNDSMTKTNNARFIFDFQNNDLDENDGNPATRSSTSLFQPTTMMIWHLRSHDEGQPRRFTTRIDVECVQTVSRLPALFTHLRPSDMVWTTGTQWAFPAPPAPPAA